MIESEYPLGAPASPAWLYGFAAGPKVPALRVMIPGALKGDDRYRTSPAAWLPLGERKPLRGLREQPLNSAAPWPAASGCSNGRSPRGVSSAAALPAVSPSSSPIPEHCDPGRAVVKGSLRPGPRSPHPVPSLRFGLRLPGCSGLALDARALCPRLSELGANELSETAGRAEDMRPKRHRRRGL